MKKIIILLVLIFSINTFSFAAGSGGDDGSGKIIGKLNEYQRAVKLVKSAKKLEKKGKLEKAKKKYQKANDYLHEANKKNPLKPDILNYLGFTTRKLGDNKNAEIYYLLGLKESPSHNGINEYLGELYLATNRPEMAKERLMVLKNCNCDEYNELKALIEGTKKSKY
tara:strand:- start:6280 stop:6780 length:501 start_codon:yes stop_codon:yes gene_type:complete